LLLVQLQVNNCVQEKIRNYYMDEIKVYQEKLIKMPSELYQMWEETQKQMGLKAQAETSKSKSLNLVQMMPYT